MKSTMIPGVIIAFVFLALLVYFSPARAAAQPPAEPLPEWASFFTAKEYHHFLDLVRDCFAAKNTPVEINDGIVRETAKGADAKFGLQNLAQLCHQLPQEKWKETIAGHFNSMVETEKQKQELNGKIGDFSKIADLLALRIWPRDYVATIGPDKVITRQDLEGTVTALVWDLPTAIRNVTPDEAGKWGKTSNELFLLALKNLRDKTQVEITEQTLGDGLKFYGLTGENFLTASHVLLLDQYPQCIGKYGVLVAIPTRHIIICYPINDASVVRVISKFVPIVIGLEKEGPGSINTQLYWRHDGRFTPLPYKLSNKSLDFTPPNEFVDLLNKLPIPPDKK